MLALILGVTSFPTGIVSTPPSMAETFFKFDFTNVFSLDMLIVLFTFLFVDIFDTLGTLIGVSTKAGMLNEKENFQEVEEPYLQMRLVLQLEQPLVHLL